MALKCSSLSYNTSGLPFTDVWLHRTRARAVLQTPHPGGTVLAQVLSTRADISVAAKSSMRPAWTSSFHLRGSKPKQRKISRQLSKAGELKLMALIKQSQSVQELHRLFGMYSHLMNHYHISALITHVAQLHVASGQRHSHSFVNSDTDTTAPSSTPASAATHQSAPSQTPPAQLTATSMRRQLSPQTNAQLTDQLLAGVFQSVTRHIKRFQGRQLANTIWAIAKLGRPPPAEVLEALLKEAAAGKKIRTFEPQHLSNLVYAMAIMRQVMPAELFNAVSQRLHEPSNLQQLKEQELANLIYAFGLMQHKPPSELVHVLLVEVLRRLEVASAAVAARQQRMVDTGGLHLQSSSSSTPYSQDDNAPHTGALGSAGGSHRNFVENGLLVGRELRPISTASSAPVNIDSASSKTAAKFCVNSSTFSSPGTGSSSSGGGLAGVWHQAVSDHNNIQPHSSHPSFYSMQHSEVQSRKPGFEPAGVQNHQPAINGSSLVPGTAPEVSSDQTVNMLSSSLFSSLANGHNQSQSQPDTHHAYTLHNGSYAQASSLASIGLNSPASTPAMANTASPVMPRSYFQQHHTSHDSLRLPSPPSTSTVQSLSSSLHAQPMASSSALHGAQLAAQRTLIEAAGRTTRDNHSANAGSWSLPVPPATSHTQAAPISHSATSIATITPPSRLHLQPPKPAHSSPPKLGQQPLSHVSTLYQANNSMPQYQRFVQVPQFNSQELCILLWGLAHSGYTPPSASIQAVLDAMVVYIKQPNTLSPLFFSSTLKSLAELRYQPNSDWWQTFRVALSLCIPRFGPQAVANVACSLARLQLALPAESVQQLYKHAYLQLANFSSQELANLLWALSQMQCRLEKADLGALLYQSAAKMSTMQNVELAMLITALTDLKVRPPTQWLERFSAEVYQRLHTMGAREQSSVLCALATLDYRPSNVWMSQLEACSLQLLSWASPRSLATYIWSFACIGYRPNTEWQRAWLDRMAIRMQAMTPLDGVSAIYAIAALDMPCSPTWLTAFWNASAPLLCKLPAYGVRKACWAISRMRTKPSKRWLASLQARASELGMDLALFTAAAATSSAAAAAQPTVSTMASGVQSAVPAERTWQPTLAAPAAAASGTQSTTAAATSSETAATHSMHESSAGRSASMSPVGASLETLPQDTSASVDANGLSVAHEPASNPQDMLQPAVFQSLDETAVSDGEGNAVVFGINRALLEHAAASANSNGHANHAEEVMQRYTGHRPGQHASHGSLHFDIPGSKGQYLKDSPRPDVDFKWVILQGLTVWAANRLTSTISTSANDESISDELLAVPAGR